MGLTADFVQCCRHTEGAGGHVGQHLHHHLCGGLQGPRPFPSFYSLPWDQQSSASLLCPSWMQRQAAKPVTRRVLEKVRSQARATALRKLCWMSASGHPKGLRRQTVQISFGDGEARYIVYIQQLIIMTYPAQALLRTWLQIKTLTKLTITALTHNHTTHLCSIPLSGRGSNQCGLVAYALQGNPCYAGRRFYAAFSMVIMLALYQLATSRLLGVQDDTPAGVRGALLGWPGSPAAAAAFPVALLWRAAHCRRMQGVLR